MQFLKLFSVMIFLLTIWSCAAEVEVGSWTYYAHGAKGGKAVLLNDRQIKLKGFSYDGRGPEAWFMVGVGGQYKDGGPPPEPCADYRDTSVSVLTGFGEENECTAKPPRFSKQDVIITLPSTMSWDTVDFVGLYCYKYQHLFGFVKIPAAAKERDLPKYTGSDEWEHECAIEQDRIIADETFPVKCSLDAPAKTDAGTFA